MKRLLSFLISMAIMLGTLPVSVAFATTDGGDGDDTTAAPQITEYPLFDENFNGATPGGELNKSNAPEKNVFSNISNNVTKMKYANDPLNGGHETVICSDATTTMWRYPGNSALFTGSTLLGTNIGGASYTYAEYDFDGDGDETNDSYYIANYKDQYVFWVEKNSTGTEKNKDWGQWFSCDADGNITAPHTADAGASEMKFNIPDVDDAVSVTYSFDFAYDNAKYSGDFDSEEGIEITVPCANADRKNHELYITTTGIKGNGINATTTKNHYALITDNEGKLGCQDGKAAYTAKDGVSDAIITSADDIEEVDFEVVKTRWNTFKIKIDLEKQQYTMYFNDKPLYFKVKDPTATYSSVIKILDGVPGNIPTLSVSTMRGSVFADREQYFDNFKAVYEAPVQTGWDGAATTAAPTDESGVYLISKPEHLAWARDQINLDTAGTGMAAASYKLVNDIDLNGKNWTPIGRVGVFKGKFDGDGNIIKNVNVVVPNDTTVDNNASKGSFGLFGLVQDATISNLGVDGVTVICKKRGDGTYNRPYALGGLVGCLKDDEQGAATTVKNCFVKNANIQCNQRDASINGGVAGFCGAVDNWNIEITNCYAKDVKLNAPYSTAMCGFVNKKYNIKLSNCYTANVTDNMLKISGDTTNTEVKTPMYAFGKGETVDGRTVNLYSSVSDNTAPVEEDTRNPGKIPYSADSSLGTVVDKNTIKSALVKESDPYCQFMADSETVNDGYPIHSFVPTKDEEAINDIITNWLDPQVTPYEEYNHMKGFNVPVEYPDDEAVSLSWDTTDGSALSVDPITGYVAITPSTSGMNTVYMTAVFERNGTTVYKSYTIRIKKLVVTTVTVTTANGAITPTVSENTTDSSKDDHSITVDYANLAEKGVTEITFMAVIQDADGEITNVGETSVAVADNNATSEDLLVTLPKAQGTDIVKYYLWDQNHVSLIDNAPTDVIGFSTKSNTSGVSLAWDRSYDDSGIDVIYKLETDGDEINREELSAAEFNKDTLKVEFDKIIDGDDYKEKAFRIIPFDNIGQIAAKSAEERNKKYKWFESSVNAMDEAVNDGLKFVASGGTDNRAKILDGHFVNVPHATSSGNTTYIFFGVSSADGRDKLTSNDNDVIIEVTYKNTSLKAAAIVYKPITGGDNGNRKEACSLPVTEDYSTVTVRVTDASPDNLMTDSSSFGIKVGGNTSENTVQIKSIKVVRTSNYPNGDEITPVN